MNLLPASCATIAERKQVILNPSGARYKVDTFYSIYAVLQQKL